MMHSIYALVDKTTNRPRYVGLTVRTPEIRRRQHIWWAQHGGRHHRDAWIRKIGADNVGVRHLAWAPTRHIAGDAERAWIALFSPGLTNLTEGGDGGLPGVIQSAATVEKRATANRGKKRSPEQRARISAAKKGKSIKTPTIHLPWTDEHRAKVLALWTPERRARESVTQRALWTSEYRAKQRVSRCIAQRARRRRERG